MVLIKFSSAFVLAATVLTGTLAAQDHKVQLAVYGGAVTPLADLGQVPYLGVAVRHFKKGINAGANAWYNLDNNLGIRVDGTYSTSTVVEPLVGCLPQCETGWTKMYLSLDLMLRAPMASGVTPYGYFGGGTARMTEKGSGRKTSVPTGRVGGGLNFTPANGAVGFFGEVGLMIYDFDQTKFTFYDKVQEDLALKVGVSIGL